MALIWVMQLAKCPSSRVLTSVFTPSHVDRNLVTSFMHSLKPARYFPRTEGSVFKAAAGKGRISVKIPWSAARSTDVIHKALRSKAGGRTASRVRTPNRKTHARGREVLLTGHLSPLKVPKMLHSHLQDVRLLQFRVSGALMVKERSTSLGLRTRFLAV